MFESSRPELRVVANPNLRCSGSILPPQAEVWRISESRRVGRFQRVGQETHEQPSELVQQKDKHQGKSDIEGHVEVGGHPGRIGL